MKKFILAGVAVLFIAESVMLWTWVLVNDRYMEDRAIRLRWPEDDRRAAKS